jgi:[ribosomal protein S5]-alanine N-acetyltransferase
MIEQFHTDRLRADRLVIEDFDDFFRMHQDPRVMATLSINGNIHSENDSRQIIETNINHWERHGYGLWMFRDKASGRFVGRGGLRHVELEGNNEVELAYSLMPEYWGKGLATEIAEVSLKVGFAQLGLMDVVGFTMKTNQASQRVLEKVGFKYQRHIVFLGLPHVLYRITAVDWAQRSRV